jgi:hypothetical protein
MSLGDKLLEGRYEINEPRYLTIIGTNCYFRRTGNKTFTNGYDNYNKAAITDGKYKIYSCRLKYNDGKVKIKFINSIDF